MSKTPLYTSKEDLAIYRHILNKPSTISLEDRYKSALKLKSVHPIRTVGAIRNRWSFHNSDAPPQAIREYRDLDRVEREKKEARNKRIQEKIAKEEKQGYRGIKLYVPNAENVLGGKMVHAEVEYAQKAKDCYSIGDAIQELQKQGAEKAVLPMGNGKKITVIFKD